MSERSAREPRGLTAPVRLQLPDLRIVPSAALRLHEECDPERVARLARRLAAEGVLRNPPLVAPLGDDAYVVLDGANRVTALQQSGVPHQVVQVVDYDDPAVVLDVWAHLLSDDAAAVRAAGPWETLPTDELRAGLAAGRLVCGLLTRVGAFGLPGRADLAERVRSMAAVVATYKGRQTIYRVQPADLDALAREYGRADALVIFPRLSKADVRAIARLPQKLPTGISRHVVPLRALRVNTDLALLRGPEPTAVKQARLDEAIRSRLLEHRVRHYPEPTVLYDE
ncbi:MAG: ParB N-terminal domain-containing protein [Armatimonadota bacterium]|nr:ParB N-terminal domain-containing protein [Armatimonadota bacterium]MDR7532491.1 ParB N-terminal domain-containing protein [Armatimonadota bacterium]MDR7535618.1 ParB N-terminal domain-containing protein [Armatimonadota bacterium]